LAEDGKEEGSGRAQEEAIQEVLERVRGLEVIYEMTAVELAQGVSDLKGLLLDDNIREDTLGGLKEKAEE